MSSDATWPTEFADFKRLDAVLKCGICYDYMTNCMITSCSHTYCSLCIRKFMQYKNQCPACFEETYEVHLRNNRPLDEVIAIFVKMKDKLQRALRLATIPIPIKTDAKDEPPLPPKTPKNNSNFVPKTPSCSRLVGVRELFKDNREEGETGSPAPESSSSDKTPKTPSASQTDKAGDDVIFNGVKIPGIFNAPISFPKVRKPDEMARCPVCEVEVPARNINIHLDSCLAAESGVGPKKTKSLPKREPLPKRLFNLLKDPALKKILKDYGLSTQGDRKALISRIQRYTVIYNSENDSLNPRPVSELIAQLEREEREEKKPNALLKSLARQQPRTVVDRRTDPQIIEQAHKAYCDENKESFKKLIEQMRAREGRNIKPNKPPPRVYSDDEDDPNRCVVFNPDVPSTSRDGPSLSDSHSLYSQATQQHYESDSDIFQDDVEGDKDPEKGLIDWSKTSVNDKETVVVSESEDEIEDLAGSSLCVGSSDETNLRTIQGTESPDPPVQEPQVPVTPVKTPSRSLHILQSPTDSENLADGDSNDGFAELNQTGNVDNPVKSSEKSDASNESSQNYEPANAIRHRSSARTPARNVDEGSDDSIDALFDKSVDRTVSPRVTRSRKKSVPRSKSSTPNSTSSRGTKRKSKHSPKSAVSNNLQETFDFLFEKYNGDCVDDNVETDEDDSSTSNSRPADPERQARKSCSEGLPTRRSARNRGNLTPIEENQTPTRKRTKRDLSPAF